MRIFIIIVSAVLLCWQALAGPLDTPLAANAKLLRTQTLVIGANGTSGDLFIPGDGVLTIDYAVEAGKSLRLGILTDAQFKEVSAGHKLTGTPIMNMAISGTGSQSAHLDRGNYAVVFIHNDKAKSANLTYRASYLEGK